jgi:hypothetical protein
MKFPMTIDGWVKGITAVTVVALSIWFPVMIAVVGSSTAPWGIVLLVKLSAALVTVVLVATALGSPTAVKVTNAALVIERRALGDYEIPWSEVSGAQEAPPLKLRGDVRRVAGNGGFLGFTGLFSVKDVGTVRCWATKLGTPTVLVGRKNARPVLLGVDDAPALLEAIRRRLAHFH